MISDPASVTVDVSDNLFRFSNLSRVEIAHGVTGRTTDLPLGGDFSYVTGDSATHVWKNRQAWCDAISVSADDLIVPRQCHGTTVNVVGQNDRGRGAKSPDEAFRRVDALITNVTNTPLAVLSADCVPVLMYAPEQRVIAAVHAGWRGVVDGIVGETINRMTSTFGVQPAELVVGIAPSIGRCCYEVGPEVTNAWLATGLDDERAGLTNYGAKDHFDLRFAVDLQLRVAGVSAGNIEQSGICTKCSCDRYFSRRGLGPGSGLFASIISLRAATDQHPE